jgi:hypothetical protein
MTHHLRSKLSLVAASGAALVVITVSGSALADFGRQGTLHIGAERLFGLVATDTETEDLDSDTMSISFMWGGSPIDRVYDRPRAAIDYFVIDSLSVGGSLGFYTWSYSDETDADVDGSGVLFSPRVGYMIGLTDMLSFWPRGGFTYVGDGTDAVDDSAFALSAEAPLVIGIGQELALSVALTLDLGLGGERDFDGPMPPDQDRDHNQFGIQLALDGFL